MAFRFHKGLPNISIFHSAKSPTSVKALELLKTATSHPYPPGAKAPLEYKLEVVSSQTPTPDQFSTIQSYIGGTSPLSTFLSSPASASPTSTNAVHKMVSADPDKMKWPIVVNWDDGEASVGSVEGVEAMLKKLSERRDSGGGEQGESGKKKGWFGF